MAEGIDRGGVSSRVIDYSTLFDDGIGEILERLDGEDKSAIMDELLDEYDMPALMDMLVKIFRFAKSKLMKSLEGEGPGDLDAAFASCVPRDRIEDEHKAVAEWALIARRGKQRVVQDSIALLAYMSGEVKFFPHNVIRRSVKRKNKRSRRKYNVPKKGNHDPKQPLISFASGSDVLGTVALGDDGKGYGSGSIGSGDGESSSDGSFFSGDEEPDLDIDEIYQSTSNTDVCVREEADPNPLASNVDSVTQVHSVGGADGSSTNVCSETAVNTPHSDSACSVATIPSLGSTGIQPPEHAPSEKLCVVDVPHSSTQPVAKKTDRDTSAAQITSSKASISTRSNKTMTTQTEWTLWGSPIADASNTLSARGTNGDTGSDRLQSEWREFERRSNERDEQFKVKLNFMRSKQIESDNVISNLKANLDSVNKKLDEAIARFQSSQNDTARQYAVSPYMYPTMMGAGGAFQPSWYPQYGFVQGDSGMYPQAPVSSTLNAPTNVCTDDTNQGECPISLADPTPQRSASPYRDPPANVNIVKETAQRYNQHANGARSKRAGASTACSDRRNSPAPNPESSANAGRQPAGNSSSRNYPITRSASAAGRDLINRRALGTTSVSPRVTLRKNDGGFPDNPTQTGTNAQRPGRKTVTNVEVVPDIDLSESWADEHVSDAELVNIADGTTPTTRNNDDSDNGGRTISRRGILEKAISDARQRVTPSRNVNTASSEPRSKEGANVRKGEKRGPGGSGDSGDNDASGTYAEAASKYKWNDVSYSPKRRKKSGNNQVPHLEAADSIPLREIFVVNLKYVNCNKPAVLENMVKEHCKSKGVSIIFAKVYLLRFDDSTANCKVVVREADEAKCLADDFWPSRVTARPWLPTPLYQASKGGKAKDDGSNAEPLS